MFVIPVDLNPADWSPQISAGLMMIGITAIFTAIFKEMALDPSRPSPPPTTKRGRKALRWFTMGVLIFGVVCLVVGVLMQFYWIEPTNPYSAASE